MTYIGDAIRRKRRAAMTSKALAAEIEISPQYLCDIELGRRLPPCELAVKLASALGEDAAEWLWLLLRDSWGDQMAEMLADRFDDGAMI